MNTTALNEKDKSWINLIDASIKFCKAKPWEVLVDQSELFCVYDLRSDTKYYCCVTGASGEFHALIAYRGTSGYQAHYRLNNLSDKENLNLETHFEQDCLIAEFTYRADLSESERKRLKKYGFKFRGFGYPKFSDYKPRYMPEQIDSNSVQDINSLKSCLEAGLIVLEKYQKDSKYLQKPGHIKTWTVNQDTASLVESWSAAPTIKKTEVIADSDSNLFIKRIQKLSPVCKNCQWELGMFTLPVVVDEENTDRFMPRLSAVLDSDTGFVYNQRILEPNADIYLSLLNTLFDTIMKLKIKPTRLVIRDKKALKFIQSYLDELHIEGKYSENLPAFEELEESMNQHFI